MNKYVRLVCECQDENYNSSRKTGSEENWVKFI